MAGPIAAMRPGAGGPSAGEMLTRNEKGEDISRKNISAARAVADTIRTSLGPKGMDKMIQDAKGGALISNDGATIMQEMKISHPTARMLVELSKAQDVEAGDGTTSVVVLAGALLSGVQKLLDRGLHPQVIAESFLMASKEAQKVLDNMKIPFDLNDHDKLVQVATTALNSKVVSQNSSLLAPMAVDAVLKIMPSPDCTNVDLKDIRLCKKVGGTVDDTELVEGLIFTNHLVARACGGPLRVQNAKIGLIQFCLSAPKTDMDNNIVVKDYQAMDRLLREERVILARMVKKIAATGCNVLLIQKSILRDAISDLALDFCAKAKILVIKDIEREDIDFISRTLCCEPVASLDHFTTAKLGSAELVADESLESGGRIARIVGVPGKKTVTVFCRASNSLILDETERSFHDAMCVIRSLIKNRAMLPGGGAPEIELSYRLDMWSRTLSGAAQLCVREYANALELIPYTLAENAALNPIETVTNLRSRHAEGDKHAGINIRKGTITDILDENVLQPLLVTASAVKLATETVIMILRIDDIAYCK